MTARRRLDLRDDRGVTMVELVVAMTIMAIVMVLSTSAVTMAFGVGQKVDSSTSTQTQTSIAWDRLEKVVRAAYGLSAPGTAGNGDPEVELLSGNPEMPTCTQLRLDIAMGQLKIRTWTSDGTPPTRTDWTALASGVVVFDAEIQVSSFTVYRPDLHQVYLRLGVSLRVKSGINDKGATTSSRVEFNAANPLVVSPPITNCAIGRSTP